MCVHDISFYIRLQKKDWNTINSTAKTYKKTEALPTQKKFNKNIDMKQKCGESYMKMVWFGDDLYHISSPEPRDVPHHSLVTFFISLII